MEFYDFSRFSITGYTLYNLMKIGMIYKSVNIKSWLSFYVVTLQHERTHPSLRPREQLLLQNYKAQRHAVIFKVTLAIEDEKLFKTLVGEPLDVCSINHR